MTLSHIYLIQKPMEFCVRQRLGQAVGDHLVSGYVGEVDSSSSHLVSYLVVLNVNILRLRVEDGIVGKSNKTLIVSSQRDCIGDEVRSSSL